MCDYLGELAVTYNTVMIILYNKLYNYNNNTVVNIVYLIWYIRNFTGIHKLKGK